MHPYEQRLSIDTHWVCPRALLASLSFTLSMKQSKTKHDNNNCPQGNASEEGDASDCRIPGSK